MPLEIGTDELPLFASPKAAEPGRKFRQVVGANSAAWKKLLGAFAVFGVVCIVATLTGSISREGPRAKAPAVAAVGELTELSSAKKAKEKETTKKVATDETFGKGWPCEPGEELFFGTCYVSCDAATGGDFPVRDNECTCCKEHPCNYFNMTQFVTNCSHHNLGNSGKDTHPPYLTECPFDGEELFEGLCYFKCSTLTYGKYPFRTGMNTCSNGAFGGNWTMGLGPCSGFGIGGGEDQGRGCLPHIPKASGAGVAASSPPSDGNRGEAPMGFTVLPMPVQLRNGIEADPKANKALEGITSVVTKS